MTDARFVPSPPAAVVLVVVALVVAGLVVDARVTAPGDATPVPVAAPLLAGSTTCAAMALGEADEVTVATVALPREDAAGALARLQLVSDGGTEALTSPPTDGAAAATPVTGADDVGAVTARWEEAPLLLSRRWAVDDTQRVPGTVEGPCPAAPATTWVVPGVATAGGAAATLHLANPTSGPASLAVTFTTPDGPVTPTRLANLAVPARGQVTLDLNEFVPEEPDLGIVVATRAGRVVAEVVQTFEAAVGGVDGRTLVPAHPTTAEAWTVPWVRAGEQETAWVWVTNPGDETTDVRLVLHTADGPLVPPDSGVTLPPGTTQRIDLRGALAAPGSAAVTVRSAPGVPIVASGAVLRAVEEDPVRSGVTVVEALAASPGPQAALSAVGGAGRARVLVVANPTEDAAVVDVRVAGTGPGQVVRSGLAVPAGTAVVVPVADELPAARAYAVVVEPVEGAVAAALVGSDEEGPLNLVSAAARPFPATVEVIDPAVVRDRSLLHPLDRVAPSPGVPSTPAPTSPAPTSPAPTVTPAPTPTAP